jgi:sulfate adenylyltransferase subunit 1 (EFTu-like GTPase family)
MRYCFIVLSEDKQCTSFKKSVSLMTYGDDNVMGVCKSIPWFNHTAIVEVLKSIGVEYTMADKESKSVPYQY